MTDFDPRDLDLTKHYIAPTGDVCEHCGVPIAVKGLVSGELVAINPKHREGCPKRAEKESDGQV